MTSLTDMWVPSLCVADMWGQVNVDRSMVNQVGSRLGFGGPGQAWIWAALSPPRGLVTECHVAF